jgi:hypothetical protein
MNRDEAQRLLDATTLRPQDVDAEARAVAESDAALKQWLAQRTAFDERVVAAFDTIPAPVHTPQDLLRAMQAEAAKARPSALKGPWPWLALAATLLLVSYPATLLFNAFGPQANDWQGEALAKVMLIQQGVMRLEHRAPGIEMLKPLLAQAGALTPGQMPAGLLRTKTFGCRVIEVSGQPATVICFDIGSGEEAHLVVMNYAHAGQLPSQSQPLLASRDGWSTASWTDGSRHYMLVTTAGAEKLMKLLT